MIHTSDIRTWCEIIKKRLTLENGDQYWYLGDVTSARLALWGDYPRSVNARPILLKLEKEGYIKRSGVESKRVRLNSGSYQPGRTCVTYTVNRDKFNTILSDQPHDTDAHDDGPDACLQLRHSQDPFITTELDTEEIADHDITERYEFIVSNIKKLQDNGNITSKILDINTKLDRILNIESKLDKILTIIEGLA